MSQKISYNKQNEKGMRMNTTETTKKNLTPPSNYEIIVWNFVNEFLTDPHEHSNNNDNNNIHGMLNGSKINN